jgi:Flp pilus assembly protein CpaB
MAEAVTTTLLEDVIVLAIGRTTEASSSSTTAAAAAQVAARPAAQSATLLVTPEQTRKIELAKSQGKISLALRNPLDQTVASDHSATRTGSLYPGGDEKPFHPPAPPPPVETPKVVEKPQPPKPRNVIEVFRGEKHVQEVFP